MKVKRLLIGVVAAIVGVPLLAIAALVGTVWMLDRTNGSIPFVGKDRTYLVHLPPSYDRSKPTPLVISLHGAAGWPALQAYMSDWDRVADENGFIVVYPSGSELPKIWHVHRGAALVRDVKFVSEVIDKLEREYNIDPARIYASGLSIGAGMTFVLSCTLSERIAAFGLVSAAQTLPSSWCADKRAAPMIAFHGAIDRLVPYNGGPLGDPFNPEKVTFPPVREWVADWAKRNGCSETPIESAAGPDVVRRQYVQCRDDATVVLYTVKNGGHSWPGGRGLPEWWVGPTSRSIDASAQMWAFFREHPLRR